MRTRRLLNAGLIAVFAATAVACGNPFAKVREAAGRSQYINDLKQVGLAMHNHHSANGRMPRSATELLAASPDLAGSTAASRLMSGEITMVWDFPLKDQMEVGTSLTVMGWSQSPVFGGNVGVLYCDGSVKQVSPAEFAAAPKAVVKAAELPPPTRPTRPKTKTRP